MTRKISFYVLAALFPIALNSGCCTPNRTAGRVAVNLRAQETSMWCWAACTQMVTEALGRGRSQCDLANQRFGQTNCCDSSCNNKTGACSRPGWVMYTESGFSYTNPGGTPLPWDTIKTYVSCKRQPLDLIDGPLGGGIGHARVIYGYCVIGGTKYLLLRDPWAPCTGSSYLLKYDDYANNTLRTLWTTNYNFK